MTRYRFGPFVVSPRERVLLRDGIEVPLIPRYFDLLVLLVARRHEAVHRNDIFATVWSDVVVSDGALTQAIRSLRRALGDEVREPAFIRTISRHGYRFVYEPVVEEPDDGQRPRVVPAGDAQDAMRPDPAGDGPGSTDVPVASPVPHASHRTAATWARGIVGASATGLVVGGLGGLMLAAVPGAEAPATAAAVLGLIGGAAGALGAAGIGAGVVAAEALGHTGVHRTIAMAVAAAVGGGVVSAVGGRLLGWTLEALFGMRLGLEVGAVEGLVVGLVMGGAHGLATQRLNAEDVAARRGGARLRLAATVALGGAIAALVLSAAGRPMVGGIVHELARASRESTLSLAPLARLVGEPDVGPVTGTLIGVVEGAAFGLGLVVGLTHRPRRGVRS